MCLDKTINYIFVISLFFFLPTACITPPQKITTDPENAQQIELLSIIKKGKDLADQNRYQAAEIEFKKALSLNDNNSGIYNDLGYALLKQKNLSEAKTYFEKALTLDPANINAQINLAYLLYQEGSTDQALQLYTELLKTKTQLTKTDLALIYQNISLIYHLQNLNPTAIRYSKLAFETEPNTYYAEQYAKLLLALDQTEEAEEFLIFNLKEKKLKSVSLNNLYAISLYSNGKKNSAFCQVNKILKLFDYNLEEYYTAKAIILLTDASKDLTKLKKKDRPFCSSFSQNFPEFWNTSFKNDVHILIKEVCYE
ncbi:MAG: tetratricopeptide repeat protein [Deltaproteobacteria bacterium]|jgi:Flp pilus assembly protein TadD|nr:tetratricopeptide repeat protein [Deltaproteobacteria bacterium]